MRIAYPLIWDAYAHSGVLNKVADQAAQWVAYGHEVGVFVLTPPGSAAARWTHPEAHVIHLRWRALRTRRFLKPISSARSVVELYQELRRFRPHVVYQRASLWYSAIFHRLGLLAPYIVELNSIGAFERRVLPTRDRLARFKETLMLRHAAGTVSVTRQIDQHYASSARRAIVIGNGIDTNAIRARPIPHNATPQLVFSGTPGQYWHGVDKILWLAQRCSSWGFHLVGIDPQGLTPSPPNVWFHGRLSRPASENIIRRADIGIGSLGLHRCGLGEASPLKVREYAAYGLPVIVGYSDVDLEGCSWCLNIGNHEDNVRQEEATIRAFVSAWTGKTIDRSEVVARIDAGRKEASRLSFIGCVLAERH